MHEMTLGVIIKRIFPENNAPPKCHERFLVVHYFLEKRFEMTTRSIKCILKARQASSLPQKCIIRGGIASWTKTVMHESSGVQEIQASRFELVSSGAFQRRASCLARLMNISDGQFYHFASRIWWLIYFIFVSPTETEKNDYNIIWRVPNLKKSHLIHSGVSSTAGSPLECIRWLWVSFWSVFFPKTMHNQDVMSVSWRCIVFGKNTLRDAK